MHYVEGFETGYPFYLDIEGAREANIASFVGRLVCVSYWYRYAESGGWELVFLYKVPVDAGNVCTAVDKGTRVDGF